MVRCSRMDCEREATVVSIETLASPFCDLHGPGGAETLCHKDVKAVPIEEWVNEICPDRPHPPHVGCMQWGIKLEELRGQTG